MHYMLILWMLSTTKVPNNTFVVVELNSKMACAEALIAVKATSDHLIDGVCTPKGSTEGN